jgi:hypothetical protein
MRVAAIWGTRASWLSRCTVLIVSVLAISLAVVDPASAKTTISVQPPAGPPGKSVTVAGGGFSPGETVNVRFDLTKVAALPADSTGNVHGKFTTPADAAPGSHGIKARGKTSGAKAKTTFLVRTNWRQYGFDNARGGANPYENVLGVDNVATLHELWNAPISGGLLVGRGQPALRDGVLYLSGGGASVDAVDVASHQLLWRGRTQSTVGTSATVYQDLVFVVDAFWTLYAFPAACGTGGADCPVLWKSGAGASPYSNPVVDSGVAYVGSTSVNGDGVAAYPAWCGLGGATCSPLWTVNLGDTTSAPALHAGVLYVQTRTEVIAVSVQSHAILWRAPAAQVPNYAEFTTSPAVAEGLVFVSTSGHLNAYPVGCASDGSVCEPRWVGEAPAGEHPSSTPSVANGRVFVQTAIGNSSSDNGHVVAFSTTCGTDGSTCTPEWVAPHLAYDNWGRPAVANGVVYVGGDRSNIAAFATDCATGGDTCTPLWTTTVSSSVSPRSEGLIVADGVVYWTEALLVRAFGP